MYNGSVPFTLQDLEVDGRRAERPEFVSFFSEDEPETEQIAEVFEQTVETPEKMAEAAEESPSAPEVAEETPSPSAEDLTRKAFEDAYAEGEKAGYEMGMRRVESIAKRLGKQIEEVVSFKQELIGKYEKLATELALAFAEAIVLKECSIQGGVLVEMVRKALVACENKNEIVVRVRNEDLKHVEELASERLKIVADDTLKEPGFVIETSMGDIDGKVSTQIEELKNALVGYHAG